ncbi:hypothetical protein U27_00344 [Candidatus Vecturithrix granuli]|uniref:Flippase-like domain-containing protein n=1 Tax=Vecturithrix granuli TaxID=1499967 RepID=A0A081C792_VECG1|nr:hypothetical protein U27_00344 [Candidatus Vecturithrix granuli]
MILSRKNFLRVFIAIIFSIGILYFLLKNIDASIFFSKIPYIDPYRLGNIVGIYLLHTLSRALRFSIITRTNIKNVYMISAIHAFLNKILPLRSGELTWPILMKKYTNTNFGKSMTLLLLLRYLDLLCVIFLFIVASFIVKPAFVNRPLFIFLVSVLIIQIASIIHGQFLIKSFSWGVKKIKLPFLTDRFEKIMNIFSQFQQYIYPSQRYWQNMGVLILLTLMSWLTIYAIYYHYIRMFQIEFEFFQVIIGASFVSLGNNLPINSFGTFGTFELTWTAGFLLLGMSKDIAIPLGLFINVSNTLLSCLIAFIGYIILTLSSRSRTS